VRGVPSHGHIGKMHKNLVKFGRVVFELYDYTDKQADKLITIPCGLAVWRSGSVDRRMN